MELLQFSQNRRIVYQFDRKSHNKRSVMYNNISIKQMFMLVPVLKRNFIIKEQYLMLHLYCD